MYISTITATAKLNKDPLGEESMCKIKKYVYENSSEEMFISKPSRPRLEKKNPGIKLKDFKNQFTISLPHKDRNIKIKLFLSGTIHITGCNTQDLIKITIDKIVKIIEIVNNVKLNKSEIYLSINTHMINTPFDAGFKINQEVFKSILIDKYNILSIFDPKEYSGIKSYMYSDDGNKTSLLMFKSGKIIASSKSQKYLEECYFKIKEILNNERKFIEIQQD